LESLQKTIADPKRELAEAGSPAPKLERKELFPQAGSKAGAEAGSAAQADAFASAYEAERNITRDRIPLVPNAEFTAA
jgi:hypothetical protein